MLKIEKAINHRLFKLGGEDNANRHDLAGAACEIARLTLPFAAETAIADLVIRVVECWANGIIATEHVKAAARVARQELSLNFSDPHHEDKQPVEALLAAESAAHVVTAPREQVHVYMREVVLAASRAAVRDAEDKCLEASFAQCGEIIDAYCGPRHDSSKGQP